MPDRTKAGEAPEEGRGTEAAGRGLLQGRFRRTPRRTFYSIGEVCSMIGIKPHILRYWESQIPELSPTKNRAGNRVYQPAQIELIALVHRLVTEERYTVKGARQRLKELRGGGSAREESSQALQQAFLRSLRQELRELYDFLDPDGVAV